MKLPALIAVAAAASLSLAACQQNAEKAEEGTAADTAATAPADTMATTPPPTDPMATTPPATTPPVDPNAPPATGTMPPATGTTPPATPPADAPK